MPPKLPSYTLKCIRIKLTQWNLARCRLIVATVMGGLIWNDPVFAHGFGYRYDLPLPLHLYLIAAGAAVCLSFVVMAYAFHRKNALHSYKFYLIQFIPRERISRSLRILVSGFSVTLFILIIAVGLFGHQSVLKNPAPVLVWVIWWVGFVYLTALVANIWPFLNPWSSIFQALEELSGFSFGKINYPSWLGVWPAFVLFMVFSWIELVWSGSEHPKQLALTILAYSALCWIGMAVYGRQTWLKRGEVFSIVFSIFARFSPLEVRKNHGGPYLRPYGSGLLSDKAPSFLGGKFEQGIEGSACKPHVAGICGKPAAFALLAERTHLISQQPSTQTVAGGGQHGLLQVGENSLELNLLRFRSSSLQLEVIFA